VRVSRTRHILRCIAARAHATSAGAADELAVHFRQIARSIGIYFRARIKLDCFKQSSFHDDDCR
jgi:hypothetical protein